MSQLFLENRSNDFNSSFAYGRHVCVFWRLIFKINIYTGIDKEDLDRLDVKFDTTFAMVCLLVSDQIFPSGRSRVVRDWLLTR